MNIQKHSAIILNPYISEVTTVTSVITLQVSPFCFKCDFPGVCFCVTNISPFFASSLVSLLDKDSRVVAGTLKLCLQHIHTIIGKCRLAGP